MTKTFKKGILQPKYGKGRNKFNRKGRVSGKSEVKKRQKEFSLPRNHILYKIWTGLLFEAYGVTNTRGLLADQFVQFIKYYWELWDYQEKNMTVVDKLQLQAQLKAHYTRRHTDLGRFGKTGIETQEKISIANTGRWTARRWDRFQLTTNNILHNCHNIEVMKENVGYGICEKHDSGGGDRKLSMKSRALGKDVKLLGTNCREECWQEMEDDETKETKEKKPKVLYCVRHQYHPCYYQPKDDNLLHKQIKKDPTKGSGKRNMKMCDCATKIYEVDRWFDCEHYQCKQSVDMYNFCLACGEGVRVR